MNIKFFEKQAEESVAQIVMSAEAKSDEKCTEDMRELLLSSYKAGGYQYAKMLEIENSEQVAYMTRRFGDSVAERLRKAQEELGELIEAYSSAVDCEDFDNFIEELADTTLVLFHLAGLFSMKQEELVSMALEKVRIRELNPNYKREKSS